MSPATVLVGFAEALAAPEVVWSLVDGGFAVVAFTRKGSASALQHSRHVVVHEICSPEKDLDAAQSDLRELMASLDAKTGNSRPILFPLDDTAVWLNSVAPLCSQWRSAGPQGTCADLALNKQIQTQMALAAGFNVPETKVAQTADDVTSFVGRVSFPVILRPAQCVTVVDNRVSKSKNWICDNQEELVSALKEWRERVPLLVQPFMSGVGEGIFGLAGAGGISAWSAHRRLRMMNPQGSGSSACISQPVLEDIKSNAESFIKKSGWLGLFMIELLRDRSGKVWFVEFNGRPWGSMALSRRQGLEYPDWHLRLVIDEKPLARTATESRDGLVCRNLGREIMHLFFVLRGPKSKAFRGWPSFWKTFAEIIRLRREDSFYNWRREDPRVFVADCYYTIYGNLFKSRG